MQYRSESSFPWFAASVSIGIIIVVGFFAWQWFLTNGSSSSSPSSDKGPKLPRLNESDAEVKNKVTELDSGAQLLALMVSDELIRKTVRAVNSLSDGWVVKEYRPIISPKGTYLVDDTGRYDAEQQKIYRASIANNARYEQYVDVLTKLKPESVASLYDYFYPLLQQAYEELGLQEASFHSVMMRALDRVVQPTAVSEPQDLRQPSVMYVYADKNVENLSSLQKLKIRLGDEHSTKLASWLTQFRVEIENSRG